ncbi:hypothetical protein BH09VER1_BH09VER1_17520 [soil metagenome]
MRANLEIPPAKGRPSLMKRGPRVSVRGFSLLELLVVTALMAIVAAFSIPALSGWADSATTNRAVSEVAGMLEQARQYAVSQNTYVWVVFNAQVDNNVDILNVTAVASKDGTDPQAYGAAPSGAFDLISRVRGFPHIQLKAAGDFTMAQIPNLPSTASLANAMATGSAFSIKMPGTSSTGTFSQSICFTPSGQARNAAAPVDFIEFGLQPAHTTTTPNPRNIMAVRVNGLTGQSRVYRL